MTASLSRPWLPGLTVLGSTAASGKSMLARSFAVLRRRAGLPTRMYKPVAVTLTVARTGRGAVDTSMMLAALAAGAADVTDVLGFRYADKRLEELASGCAWPAELVSEDGLDFGALDPEAVRRIRAACARQGAEDGFLICEGAGAIGDLPADQDLSNSALAVAVRRPVLLAVSARRGAALTSLVGNRQLMSAELGALVAGFVLNNCAAGASGQRSAARIEQETGWPCLGLVPRIPLYDHLGDRGTGTSSADTWEDELEIVARFLQQHLSAELLRLIGVPGAAGLAGAAATERTGGRR
jgi:cobyrinic acid a,c-diamide synthase